MSGREPAWRVFAQDLGASTQEERGSGERAPAYVISPLGVRANRVLVAGRIGQPESVGRDTTAPSYRAELADPTATIVLTAGGFQPRALAAFQRQQPGELVLIVGRASLYRGRGGPVSPSVRVESMRRIDADEYRRWLAETLDHTLRRLVLVEHERHRLRSLSTTPSTEPAIWAAGAREACRRYPSFDEGPVREGLRRVLQELGGGPPRFPLDAVPAIPLAPTSTVRAATLRVTRTTPPPVSVTPPSVAGRAEEAVFLDIIDELCESSADGYADLQEAIRLAGRRGVSPMKAEELVSTLEENGALEEPLVGKIRRA